MQIIFSWFDALELDHRPYNYKTSLWHLTVHVNDDYLIKHQSWHFDKCQSLMRALEIRKTPSHLPLTQSSDLKPQYKVIWSVTEGFGHLNSHLKDFRDNLLFFCMVSIVKLEGLQSSLFDNMLKLQYRICFWTTCCSILTWFLIHDLRLFLSTW